MSQNSDHGSSQFYRLLIGGLTLLTTGCGLYVFTGIIIADEVGALDVSLLILFAVLFTWVVFPFWMATAGFAKCLSQASEPERSTADQPPENGTLPRTAVLLPVYNEDPWSVFAGLTAMYGSLKKAGGIENFDFFILSDTTDPNIWLQEELAWGWVTNQLPDEAGVYYRRRPQNRARKSGNIADFCQRWGSHYEYMIVLDADSILAGPTMVEMVRRMETRPDVGILQVPPVPVNRGSLMARLQEFAASVYGRVYTVGYGLWSQTDGNYWGHNAIIRVDPFMRHCGLPVLDGHAPLGGEILSHDFVEAAMMRRAGWKVVLADDLDGSYEECPATLIDLAIRDQRWCQGNLQHLSVLFSPGLHLWSRLHMGMGIMSYLSSSLWLLFMCLGIITVATTSASQMSNAEAASAVHLALWLFVITMVMLVLPKVWGVLLVVMDPRRRQAYGGVLRPVWSMMLEVLFSVLIAPIMMAFHVTFVAMTFMGKKVQWTAQRREESATTFREAFEAHAGQTIIGLLAVILIERLTPGLLWWFSPVLVGLVLSIPLSMLLSSVRIGQWMQSKGLLTIAEDMKAPEVLSRHGFSSRTLKKVKRLYGSIDPVLQVIVDPAFNALHTAILKSNRQYSPSVYNVEVQALERVVLFGGPTRMSADDKMKILSSVSAMEWLHQEAWIRWSNASVRKVLEPAMKLQSLGNGASPSGQTPPDPGKWNGRGEGAGPGGSSPVAEAATAVTDGQSSS